MGELHVNMNITLDGVIQANGGTTEQDAGYEHGGWERPYGDAESGARLVADVEASDALLLGRTTWEIFAGYWPGQPSAIGRAFDRVPKYVASRGTPDLAWGDETGVQLTDAATDVRRIRDQHAQVHTWGSADLLRTLFREGLADQLNLWVSPVVIGTGKRLFPEGSTPTRFELAEAPTVFPAGAVLLRYRRLDGPPETDSSRQSR
jgi:dihydrofolate reductase